MEANAEKTALAEQRAQKKATRRAAFIQEVAEAVVKQLSLSISEKARKMPLTQAAGMWVCELAAIGALPEASPSDDGPHSPPQ